MGRYHRLFRYAFRYWRGWAVVLLMSLCCALFGLLQAWPMKIIFDHVLSHAPLPAALASIVSRLPGTGSSHGLLTWAVSAGLAVFALNSVADVVLTVAWIRVGQRMVYDLAGDMFAHLQRCSLLFHGKNAVGDSISRITHDSWCVHTLVDHLLFKPKLALITTAAVLGLMAQMDISLTVLSLTVVPFLAGLSWAFRRAVRATARSGREIESNVQSHVQRTLSGIQVVQAFGCEAAELRRFVEYSNAAIRTQKKNAMLGSVQGLGAGLATTFASMAVLWIGVHRVWDGRLTVGSIVVFLTYLSLLQSQFRVFTGLYTSLQAAAIGMERVLEVLETAHEIQDRAGATPLPPVRGRLRLENVTFGYDVDRPVLRGVNLEIDPGETVAIVGLTGAGKSTLAGLIPRFFDPWQGRVTIDGHDLRDVTLHSLRTQVALVLQESFLFPASIAGNIAYGRPGAVLEDVIAAAKAAGAHDFIMKLHEGYETVIGERGSTLSGGERQRLSIARALLADAPILVLDEPTSALDASTEDQIMTALDRLMAGRTTLIIAHRASTIRRADRILLVEDGRLTERERQRPAPAIPSSESVPQWLDGGGRAPAASAVG